jgi:hypothetical protein
MTKRPTVYEVEVAEFNLELTSEELCKLLDDYYDDIDVPSGAKVEVRDSGNYEVEDLDDIGSITITWQTNTYPFRKTQDA